MKLIRYLDVYSQNVTEEGELYNEILLENFTCPLIINPSKITTIEPYYSLKGKLFKNVSILTYDTGDKFKVVGNYKKLDKKINKPHKKIGF